MSTDTSESAFETELVDHLTSHGWEEGDPKSYRADLALDPEPLLAFVRETQPEQWEKLEAFHNGDAEELFLKRVRESIDKFGTIHVLRRGIKHGPGKFFLCQFKPAFGANPKVVADYDTNRLTVTRQVHYSPFRPSESFDLVLFLNGVPVATSELKTDLAQSIKHAKSQYRNDRPAKDRSTKQPEPLLTFKTGAIVHFAVSTDEVWMTTKLVGKDTFFLPFNRGHDQGAGNPPTDGYATSYLWEEVWQRDNWLEILGRYVYVEKSEEVDPDTRAVRTKEAIIFPRYHQRDAVRRLIATTRDEGPGNKYLIQHSAGSGKTKTISWLSHQLSDLHDTEDTKIFDSVVVITDRRVLDSQLQDAIYEIDHKDGVVAPIDENSEQLADALTAGRKIIITTIQKFPFVIETVGDLSSRSFAVVIDEAHGSQTGKAAHNLRQVLTDLGVDGPEDEGDITSEEVMMAAMAKRQPPKNVSFFAFTATPKPKTIELFGRKGVDGLPEPFHVYSMRQAIEENFILDVLKNYISYDSLYRIATTEVDKEVSVSKAKKAIARHLTLHPHSIAQKVEIIVEHFRDNVMQKIAGKAKAMIVTDSRKAAVRYKIAIDAYIREKDYELGTLVAFSGSVSDPEMSARPLTEASMNDGVSDPRIKTEFAKSGYRVLIVANKYQVGFDQPLLHTMYVDKRLAGVLAVQTLSRLNRTHPDKEDTCIIDFRNEPGDILDAFLPFYRTAQLSGETDPNLLHDLSTKLRDMRIFMWEEVEGFAKAFYDPKGKQAALHGFLKPAADRFRNAEPEQQVIFRKDLGSFVRAYEFLTMVLPYSDTELESLAVFGRALAPRLGRPDDGDSESGEDAIELTHFRLRKAKERALSLETGDTRPMAPTTAVGSAVVREEQREWLSEIVRQLNDLFGGQDLGPEDTVQLARHTAAVLSENEALKDQAKSNSMDQFAIGSYPDAVQEAIISMLERYESMGSELLNKEDKMSRFTEILLPFIWNELRGEGGDLDELSLRGL